MNDEKLNQFLDELTALCHKHGLGINGGELYELEADDSERRYSADDNSLLDFA